MLFVRSSTAFASTWYLVRNTQTFDARGWWLYSGTAGDQTPRAGRDFRITRKTLHPPPGDKFQSRFSPTRPFRTAVPFCGQISHILSSLSPRRDCSSKRVKRGTNNENGGFGKTTSRSFHGLQAVVVSLGVYSLLLGGTDHINSNSTVHKTLNIPLLYY